MPIKGILLDLDDTLYEYEPTHRQALDVVFDDIEKDINESRSSINAAFDLAKGRVKSILPAVASGHSRILYFQLMFEKMGFDAIPRALNANDKYWSAFLENIRLTEDAERFFKRIQGIPICLLTDLTAEIQYRKILRLRLEPNISFIVSSEETGVEKPHPFMFQTGLVKLGLARDEVIMIGDSLKKDILGASFLGIRSYWLNRGASVALKLPAYSQEIRSLDEVVL
ncbi:HAD-IA family hydrolase [Allohahella marinimesophila]|uniref:HAD family hydrolase n=1 Tax=Allohahella marinimesophila TaxID=1054972 RepID=A0ABP7P1X1_9GAMM